MCNTYWRRGFRYFCILMIMYKTRWGIKENWNPLETATCTILLAVAISQKGHQRMSIFLSFPMNIKHEWKKSGRAKNWPLMKILNFDPIKLVLRENKVLMRGIFSPNFIQIGQQLWIFLFIVKFWGWLLFFTRILWKISRN